MSTTAKLTASQQRVLAAVGKNWRTAAQITMGAGVRAAPVLNSLYTRGLVDRRRIEAGRLPLEWRLQRPQKD